MKEKIQECLNPCPVVRKILVKKTLNKQLLLHHFFVLDVTRTMTRQWVVAISQLKFLRIHNINL